MRKAMIEAVDDMIRRESDTSLFLVDIGVWAFRDILKEYPERALNIGIFEDGMVSLAAGMALGGMIPTIYGMSPFIVSRAMEQLKLDFAYQKLQGNFITTGASYDFPAAGYSHYCPEDLGVISMIPGFEFIAPGTASEFTKLFEQTHRDGHPTYYRLSDHVNRTDIDVDFGKAVVIQTGKKATVIAVSTTLDAVMEACAGMDVSILYYTTLLPFDRETLRKHYNGGRFLLCEPHFEGTLSYEIYRTFFDKSVLLSCIGVKREIPRNYGSKAENDACNGLFPENISNRISKLLKEAEGK